jgi:hypothetical protein
MSAKIAFFPVDNGDMTLIELFDGRTLLIDVNIRADADDPNSLVPDVARDLRDRLKKDRYGRPFVDAFLITHPDADHCRGFARHFHTGPLADYVDDRQPPHKKRIVIGELWSSPLVFRRAGKLHVLCEDAKTIATEARRRVAKNRLDHFAVDDGDRILLIGEDVDGKTDDLGPILAKVDSRIQNLGGRFCVGLSALVLGPLPFSGDEHEEEELSKNDSSVILNMRIGADPMDPDGCNYLTGGDAEVGIWERQWYAHKSSPENLAYDLLQTPHHCSWHSLSHESWSESGHTAEVSKDARSALAQARPGAIIVASSAAIKNDDNDPPCFGAQLEYSKIARRAGGKFICTGEYPSERRPETLVLLVTKEGVQEPTRTEGSAKAAAALGATASPMPHG